MKRRIFRKLLALTLLLLAVSCAKENNLLDRSNSIIIRQKKSFRKSSIGNFFVFQDTSTLDSVMSMLINMPDTVLNLFEANNNFLSIRRYYNIKWNEAVDTLAQLRWEECPVEDPFFATVMDTNCIIEIQDTLYLIDVPGKLLFKTDSITSTTIAEMINHDLTKEYIDTISLSHNYRIGCDENGASNKKDDHDSPFRYSENGAQFRVIYSLKYRNYFLWHSLVSTFNHQILYQNKKWKDNPIYMDELWDALWKKACDVVLSDERDWNYYAWSYQYKYNHAFYSKRKRLSYCDVYVKYAISTPYQVWNSDTLHIKDDQR